MLFHISLWTVLIMAISCGQDPAFDSIERDSDATISTQGTRDIGDNNNNGDDENDDLGEGKGPVGDIIGDGPGTDPEVVGGSDDEDEGDEGGMIIVDDPADINIPNADGDDLDALHKCLTKWGQVPFQTAYVKKIAASVTVGGIGNAINDTEQTPEPQLILITAAVNVGGSPTYNFLNRNGYYCMKVNVNVNTDLNINLHCNARMADSLVGVNVGSVMTDNVSSIGVHVGSEVTVNTVRPAGDDCIR